jgi:hypothetical protein
LTGNREPLRRALAEKRAALAGLEVDWVAAAEAEAAGGAGRQVRIDDRSTWDKATWTRYLAAAATHEPVFKPRIMRLLSEIDSLEALLARPETQPVSAAAAVTAWSRSCPFATTICNRDIVMPTTIRLTTTSGSILRGPSYDMLRIDLLGPSLATEDVLIRTPSDVTAAVKRFGEAVRAAHPNASFKVNVQVPRGQRKPAGFDAAQKAGAFGDRAFLRVENEKPSPDTADPAKEPVA